MLKALSRYTLLVAWVIALVALIATLYSEVIIKMPVCPLCWYQRVCIYPLALILGIATYRDDRRIAIYTAPLALLGALFALYQYLEQMIPGFAPINLCFAGNIDCSDIHFQILGFVTFPFLSLIASLCIFVLLVFSYAVKEAE